MQRRQVHGFVSETWEGLAVAVYLASDVDARLAKAARIMREHLFTEGDDYFPSECRVCRGEGKHPDEIQHEPDCALHRWLSEK